MKSAMLVMGILVVVFLTASCGDGAHTEDMENHTAHDEAAATQTDDGLGLTLNDGHKWEMDEHTRTVFAKMADSFLNADQQSMSTAALKQAGAGLLEDINQLIQGCTMQGAAHDQLHIYLTGYIPAVESLTESGSAENARTVMHYLERYDEYFE